MNQPQHLEVCQPEFFGRIGIARRTITPPVGINSRMWGSAAHDVAASIHRPLFATVLTIWPFSSKKPFVLASLDLGWWRSLEDEWAFREPILQSLSLDESQFLAHLTHTHAGPSISLQAAQKPGGEKIKSYLLEVRQAVIDAAMESYASVRPATLTWNMGRCNLACHRNQPHPNGNGVIVGYDPITPADDTLLVGRVTDESGSIIGTLVNYACHPTTLGATNTSISPDYVGAMRELVEQATEGAPCFFLNGAAGELAPRQQYSGSPEVADQNGQILGYAVLSTLADMLPPGRKLQFDRVENSAAILGCWQLADNCGDTAWDAKLLKLTLPQRATDTANSEPASSDDRVAIERRERATQIWNGFHTAGNATIPIWLWKFGRTLLVSTPCEMHSPFQLALRCHFKNYAVIVANLVNGWYGYLPPRADFEKNTYQCKQSYFEMGTYETVTAACIKAGESLIERSESMP